MVPLQKVSIAALLLWSFDVRRRCSLRSPEKKLSRKKAKRPLLQQLPIYILAGTTNLSSVVLVPRYTAFALEKNSHIITIMAVLSLILASILLATTTLATPIVDVSLNNSLINLGNLLKGY